MQRLILFNTLLIVVHTSLTLKSNICLYKLTDVIAIAQKYGVFSMNTSNDKAGYIMTFWFGLTALMFIALEKKNSKLKHRHWLHLKFHFFVYEDAPPQYEVSMHH